MADEYGQVRPGHPTYEADVKEIRYRILRGELTYVEHAENMTAHKLLFMPGQTATLFSEPWGTNTFREGTLLVFYLGHAGPLIAHLDGSDWVHYTYAAEKFGIEKYPGDAVSLANLINRILGWGEDKMQTEAG